jgi:predicted protein tyrosine phosphatase
VKIWVCAIDEVEDLLGDVRPGSVISLSGPADIVPSLPQDLRHLTLTFGDVAHARGELLPPTSEQVKAMLTFAEDHNRAAPMLVHCWRGVGRSPAAAFVIACCLSPGRAERDIAGDVYRDAPSIRPNRLLVAIGDAVLKREGRMIAAIEENFDGDGFGAPFAIAIPRG